MSRVLVTGATGNIGREVVSRLDDVRAFARTARVPEGVDVAIGDLGRPETLVDALDGVEAVFLIWPFLTVEGAPAVLEAIAGEGRRVVYLSSSGVNSEAERQTDPINQVHADMERLIASSGLEWTVLRADTIASNALGWAGQIRSGDVVSGPEIAATAVVDPRDVAGVAVRVLSGGHAKATYVLTGPEVVSRGDQVRAIGEAIGRPLRFEPVPVAEARAKMLADGRPPALVEALLASASGRARSEVVSPAVQELTGSPARTFGEWAHDHADAFR